MDSQHNLQYQPFLARLTPERLSRFSSHIRQATGFDYPFSITPYIVPGAVLDHLCEITEAMLRLLMAPSYQQHIAATPWFLPQTPIAHVDCHGAMDFHLTDGGGKLIEVNFTPPGFLAFNRLAEEAMVSALGLTEDEEGHLDGVEIPIESYGRSSTSAAVGTRRARLVNHEFERRLLEIVTSGHRGERWAIAVNHTSVSEYFRLHYQYLQKIFRCHGGDAEVVFAEHLTVGDDGAPHWDGKRFDRVFNLVIPRLMEHQPEDFPNTIAYYRDHPERVVPNLFGWKLGTKAFLPVCHNLMQEDFGISAADRDLIMEATLSSHLMAEFSSPEALIEAFGGLDKLVIKPLDNYDTRGVYIQPDIETLGRVFAAERDIYVCQAFQAPTTHPFVTADGETKLHQICLRIGFAGGEICGIRAKSFETDVVDSFVTPVVRI